MDGGQQAEGWAGGEHVKPHLSFSSLVREGSLRSTGRSMSEPGVRAASGGRTQAGKARGLRCRRPHGSGGEAKAGGAPGLSFWAKTAPESRQRTEQQTMGARGGRAHSGTLLAPCLSTATHRPSAPPHPSPSPPALTECGAAQASKGPVGEGSQGGEACGTPKGICGRKGGRSEHWAAGSEQASWTGKEAGQQAGPGKVLRFNVQCVV